MENANLPPTNNRPLLPAALRAQIDQELHVILAFVDTLFESIEQFLNNFANQPNDTNMNNLESDDEAVDTPLVFPFPPSDNDSNDEEVLNELTQPLPMPSLSMFISCKHPNMSSLYLNIILLSTFSI
ncbi:hypothetical protein Tco_0198425 [Tanacetum coccineum]